MSRPNRSLTPLQARKQLLVLEAEVQRDQFCADLEALSDGVNGLARKASSYGSMASVAALVAGGMSAFRGRKTEGQKPSKLSRFISLAKWATSAWLMVRSKTP